MKVKSEHPEYMRDNASGALILKQNDKITLLKENETLRTEINNLRNEIENIKKIIGVEI